MNQDSEDLAHGFTEPPAAMTFIGVGHCRCSVCGTQWEVVFQDGVQEVVACAHGCHNAHTAIDFGPAELVPREA